MLQSIHNKNLIIISGPNGSGKTTLAREFLKENEYEYLSADDIAYELNFENPESVKIQAGKAFFNRLDTSVKAGKQVLIESTLSGKTLLPLLQSYKKEYGYTVIIVFTFVTNVQVCNERIAIRVQKGGHDVPMEDVNRRFSRSFYNFWNLYRYESDQWHLYYSSENDFQEIVRSVNQKLNVLDETLFAIFKEMVNKE